MPEVTIKYTSAKTLEALKDLSKYLDFVVSKPKEKKEKKKRLVDQSKLVVNGVTIIPGDRGIDISELSEVFTGKNIDAEKLREESWIRNK